MTVLRTRDAVWTGFYYDGRTANRESVEIAIDPGALRLVRPDGSVVHWPIGEMRQSQGGHGRERLRLEFGSDPVESLVIEQPGLAEALRALAPNSNPTLRTRRDSRRLVMVLVTVVALTIAAYVLGAAPLARWLAPRVPPEWEEELGRATVERMLPAGKTCDDPVAVAGVQSVLDRLLATVPASGYTFRLHLSRDTLVNAFAAPGGFVVINAGLLFAAKSPEELAGVLAHEVQHVLQRHSMQAVIREVPLRIALATLSGNAGVENAAAIAGTLGALRYRRDQEREADVEGMRMLHAARIAPHGAASFMRTLASRGGNTPRFVDYLSSHPNSIQRAEALEAMSGEARYEPVPLMDATGWRNITASLRNCTSSGTE